MNMPYTAKIQTCAPGLTLFEMIPVQGYIPGFHTSDNIADFNLKITYHILKKTFSDTAKSITAVNLSF